MHSNDKTVTYNLTSILEEIRSSEGLPETLTTEAQLWDEILKKESFLMPQQLLPLIKEVHGKTYPPDTAIKPLATEYSVERSENKKFAGIRADITLQIGERDIYHFECQLKKDGTMAIRMLEYDVHIALNYAYTNTAGQYELQFPKSAVLYLQSVAKLPKQLSCIVHFQDGTSHKYCVPVFQVQEYSLEEIHSKHLSVLIPFLPLRFRASSSTKLRKSSKEELTDFFQELIIILEKEVADGYLTENNRKTILSLLSKSMIRVFYKDPGLLEEVIVLTAPLLELEFEKAERLERELVEKLAAKDEEMKWQLAQMQAQLQAQMQAMEQAHQKEVEILKAELAKYKSRSTK